MQNILKEYWDSILLNYTDKDYANDLFSNLIKQYSENSRHYHNVIHIQNMLELSAKYSSQIKDLEVLQLAIFYHDIIYNSLSKTNEIDSSKMAFLQLSKTNFPNEKTKLVEQFILSTQKHFPLIDNTDLRFFLDFDLAILGKEKRLYEEYATNIRVEYKWVPTFIYKKKRKEVLQQFLFRKHIYFTEVFINKFENIARENLKYEIEILLK